MQVIFYLTSALHKFKKNCAFSSSFFLSLASLCVFTYQVCLFYFHNFTIDSCLCLVSLCLCFTRIYLPQKTNTHSLSHAQTHTRIHTHAYTHLLSLSHKYSLTFTHSHTHTLSLSHTHTLTHTHTH